MKSLIIGISAVAALFAALYFSFGATFAAALVGITGALK